MCKKNIDIPLSLCLFFPPSLYLASLVVWWLPLVGTSSLILLLLALLPTFLSYTCLSACLSRSPPFLFVSLYLYLRSLLASYFFSILFHFISIFSSLLVLRSLLLNKPLLYLCTYLSEWETKDRKRQKEEGLYLLLLLLLLFFFFFII